MNVYEIRNIIKEAVQANEIISIIGDALSEWNEVDALSALRNLEESHNILEVIGFSNYPRFLFWAARVHVISAEKGIGDKAEHINIARAYLDRVDKLESEDPDLSDTVALYASIENIEKGPDAALRILSDLSTPYATRIRLAMYIAKKDLDSAIDLIEKTEPHKRWCDLAISAYLSKGRMEDAQNMLAWVRQQKDDVKYSQCVVHFADAALTRAIEHDDQISNRSEPSLSQDSKEKILEVLDILSYVLNPVFAKGSIDSGLDEAASKVAWRAFYYLGEREKITEITRLMLTRTPVPTDVARSVVHGYISAPDDLPSRLREEYPGDFEAHLLAVHVQIRMGQPQEGYENAKDLVEVADTNAKKEELFRIFQQLSHELAGEVVMDCEQISELLAAHNPDLQKMHGAAKALRGEGGQIALELLDAMDEPEDVYAIQLRGNALLQLKRTGEAADVFYQVARKTGNLHFYQMAADQAFEAGNHELAAKCSEKIAALQPENLSARRNLASLYISDLEDMKKAEKHFRALYTAEPNKLENAFNLALCLAHLYRPEESLLVFEEACARPEPDIQLVLGRSQLLMNLRKPFEAYTTLKGFREGFWKEPQFLLVFQGIAFAAGEEEAAVEAFSALNELRADGQIDEHAFRALPVDEAVKVIQEQAKASQARNEHLHLEMLQGRMPWIWAAQVNNLAAYSAWRSRTQEFYWVGSEPVNRANYCVYATNGFHAREDEDGRRALLSLECPAPGGKVVADLSALITLHRLGLLDHAASWFGEILVPQAYLHSVLEDSGKMVSQQHSKEQVPKQIKQAILTERIGTYALDQDADSEISIVDEHDDSDVHCYRLIDVVEPIYEVGVMEETLFDRARKACGKSSGVDVEHPVLTLQRVIRIDLISLKTLTALGLLDTVADFYQVQVAEGVLRELNDRIQEIRLQEETLDWHFDLWDTICDDARFRFVPHTIPSNMLELASKGGDLMAFLSTFIARDQGLSLLADDRMCQAFTLNDAKNSESFAFGSDALIRGLFNEDRLDANEEADAYLKLFGWRYRFLVPPSRVLVNLARRYRSTVPGAPLRLIAAYVHDCMRDAGLFGGAETTDQGESMAMRLWLTWATLCSEFLVEIWNDEEFTEETAKNLTRWCVKELLPSMPKVINGEAKVRAADMTARLLISHILINSHSVMDEQRMSTGMQTVQQALFLSNDEYSKIIIGVLQDADRT